MTKENEKESQKAEGQGQGGKGAKGSAQAEAEGRDKRLEPNLPEYDAKQKEYERMLEEDRQRTAMLAGQRAEDLRAQAASSEEEAKHAEKQAKEAEKEKKS
jgi:hypothetical protein